MNLIIMNQNFEKTYVLDSYESLLWVDKFYEAGTFEIYTPFAQEILDFVKADYYIQSEFSDHTMIVEDISISSDIENGSKIKIIGRDISSILDRRIIWKRTNIDGNLQDGIIKMLEDNVIFPESRYPKPSDLQTKRKISNFEANKSTDTRITELTLDHQYTGESLLEVISGLCEENDIGFKVLLTEDYKFIFELYAGTDRSYKQDSVPYVVFSPSFDNIINSNYLEQNSITKNVGLVAGEEIREEGEEEGTRTTVVVGDASGISRKETYIDGGSIRQADLSIAQYKNKLISYGKDALIEINKEKKSFDGQCETTQLYRYDRDFFMGDIIQMSNEYGIESSSRVIEFTWSVNDQGLETYPTFIPIEDEEEEVNS